MKNYKKGGYAIIDASSTTIYDDCLKAIESKKPILIYVNDKSPHFAETATIDDGVITINGSTTITSDNVVTGDFSFNGGGASTDLKSNAEFLYAINGKSFNYNKFLQLLTSKGININEDISGISETIGLNIGQSNIMIYPYNTDVPTTYSFGLSIGSSNIDAVDTNSSTTLANMVWDQPLGPFNILVSDYSYTDIFKPNITINSSDTLITDITIDDVIALFDDGN